MKLYEEEQKIQLLERFLFHKPGDRVPGDRVK